MPQLDKATFNHQLIMVSLSFLTIYLVFSLLIMPRVFASVFTRNFFFRLSRFSILQWHLSTFFHKQREEYNFLSFYARFE